MNAVKYVVQSNQVLANGLPVFTGSFAECGAYVVAALNGAETPVSAVPAAPVETPARAALDMSRGRLYHRGGDQWCAWHPDYNHPIHGHKLLVGTEAACRRVLGLAPSAESKAIAAAAVSEIRATLDEVPAIAPVAPAKPKRKAKAAPAA